MTEPNRPRHLGLISIGPIVALAACAYAGLAQSAPTCHPLLVLIEGGSASSDGDSMEALHSGMSGWTTASTVLFDNGYFGSGLLDLVVRSDDPDYSAIADELAKSGFWPVVIVGHSLGAAAAYFLARKTPAVLLVTLDAVSSPDELEHPGVRWINVYAKNAPQIVQFVIPWLLGDSFMAEDWEHEDRANVNLPIRWISHSNVATMFERSRRHVDRALMSCPARPAAIGSINPARWRRFCDLNDGVSCSFSSRVKDISGR